MKTLNTYKIIKVVIAVNIIVMLSGCCVYDSPKDLQPADEIQANLDSADFFDQAADKQTVDMNHALYGISLLANGEGKTGDFKSRVEDLKKQGIVPDCWNLDPNQPLTKGKLAYMIYKACGIKEKGLTLTLLGPTQRYCLRELQYHKMMGSGIGSMQVTGMEYVAVISRADVYKQTGKFPNAVGETK